MKPRVFVGSSSEGKIYADAVVELLGDIAICQAWHQGLFEIGGNAQSSLIRELSDSDFSIIILTADDESTCRGMGYLTPRDNLIFEAGISFGTIDPTRTFVIPQKIPNLKIPTDLAGFTFAQSFDANLPANQSLAPAIAQIRRRISELNRRPIQHYCGGKDRLVDSAIELLQSAGKNIILFGRDLSWAERYADTIRKQVDKGVRTEVFSDKSCRRTVRSNAKILYEAGAKIHYCETDPRIKLTLIDHEAIDVCQFMISFKERNRSYPQDGADQFLYRYTIHDAKDSLALWHTLIRLYESLRKESVQSRRSRNKNTT